MYKHVTFILRTHEASQFVRTSFEDNLYLGRLITDAKGKFLGLAKEEPTLNVSEWRHLISSIGYTLLGLKSVGHASDVLIDEDGVQIYLHIDLIDRESVDVFPFTARLEIERDNYVGITRAFPLVIHLTEAGPLNLMSVGESVSFKGMRVVNIR